jgi:histone H3/H4
VQKSNLLFSAIVNVINMEFTLQPLRRLFKRAGAKRVSDKAALELGHILESRAKEILSESKRLSEHSGRRTVMREDVKMARKHMKK